MAEEEIGYTTVDQLDPAQPLEGGEAIHGIQNEVDVRITPLQLKTYLGTGAVVKTGSCNSAANAMQKAITLNDYVMVDNDIIAITFTNANTYGDPATAQTYPQLVVTTSAGNKTLDVCDSCGHYAGAYCWNAGDRIEFRIANNMSKAIMLNTDVRQVKDGIIYYSDGRTVYNKQTVDSVLNSALGELAPKVNVTGHENYYDANDCFKQGQLRVDAIYNATNGFGNTWGIYLSIGIVAASRGVQLCFRYIDLAVGIRSRNSDNTWSSWSPL